MKRTNCYLCKSYNAELLFTFMGDDKYLAAVFDEPPKIDMNWMICRDCALIYRSPVLDHNEYERLYENYDTDVFSDQSPDEYFNKIISLPIGKSENREKIKWLKGIISNEGKSQNLNILDVGCGGGTLLHVVNEELQPKKMCGVELNKAYANLAKRKLNADIRNIPYKNGIFKGKFDLIINTKVLEHIPQPLPFLEEMNKDLSHNGILFIEVPHFFDMYNFPLDDERFAIPHIYFFSENTLGALLKNAGFNVLQSRIFDGSRKRSYLQIVAKKCASNESECTLNGPLDDVSLIINKVRNNQINTKLKSKK